MREGVEHYSQVRALQAVERSDVAIVVADATEVGLEADLAAVDWGGPGAPRATLLVMNKWDLGQPDLDHIRGMRANRASGPRRDRLRGDGARASPAAPGGAAPRGARPTRIPTRDLNEALRGWWPSGPARSAARGACPSGTWSRPPRPHRRSGSTSTTARPRRATMLLAENRPRQRFDLDGVPPVLAGAPAPRAAIASPGAHLLGTRPLLRPGCPRQRRCYGRSPLLPRRRSPLLRGRQNPSRRSSNAGPRPPHRGSRRLGDPPWPDAQGPR